MLDQLRENTRELHQQLEGENLAAKIMDHSISLEEYKLLLYQNFLAYQRVEKSILEHLSYSDNNKTQNLSQDLKALEVIIPEVEENILNFECLNEAEAVGAAYVIEGSAMGGLMIGREIENCDSLDHLPKQKFFSGDRSSMEGWNHFLKFLRSRQFDKDEIDQAANKAKDTFILFREAFALVPQDL